MEIAVILDMSSKMATVPRQAIQEVQEVQEEVYLFSRSTEYIV